MNLNLPDNFNSVSFFIDRHLDQGRGDEPAITDADGRYSYAELARRVNSNAHAFTILGLAPGSRVVLALHDTIAFPAIFWGAIKAGVIPVPLNTLLEPDTYGFILKDSGAAALVVDETLCERFAAVLDDQALLEHVVVQRAGDAGWLDPDGTHALHDERFATVPTAPGDTAFWLYSSGSTGNPKGVQHRHRNLVYTAETYAREVLAIGPRERVFSAAKLFFAYGLGNGMTFPFAVGAEAVLMRERPTPQDVRQVLDTHRPDVFFGVPTLYAAMLADTAFGDSPGLRGLRLCVSAGEPLPEEIGRRWQERFGLEILDGVGSTEMLHIYVSNRAGDVRYGTSGRPVPGYQVRLRDANGADVAQGEMGEMHVRGLSMTAGYWSDSRKNEDTFCGEWMKTGDIYVCDMDGYYRYCGRNDDMFKSGGNWVSPTQVEATLIKHPKVLEAGVVGHADASGNLKPKAFVVLADPSNASLELARELQAFVKQQLEMWKYPRWIEFVEDLPKTATGKLQRYKLRSRATS